MATRVTDIPVDAQQDLHAVPGPLGDFGRGQSLIEPQRHRRAAQIVPPASKRRRCEREGTGLRPDIADRRVRHDLATPGCLRWSGRLIAIGFAEPGHAARPQGIGACQEGGSGAENLVVGDQASLP